MRVAGGVPSPDGPPSLNWPAAPTRRRSSGNRRCSSDGRSVSRMPWRASARLDGHWSPWACPNRIWSWRPSTRSGRCSRSSRRGHRRPAATFVPPGTRLGDFSVLDIVESTGTEGLAAAAVVFAVVGSTAQRSWTYERLLPLRGQPRAGRRLRLLPRRRRPPPRRAGRLPRRRVRGRGALPRRGRPARATRGRRLGTAVRAGPQPSCQRRHSTRPATSSGSSTASGTSRSRETHAQLPDAKGLRDLATLIGAQGREVHVFTLLGFRRRPARVLIRCSTTRRRASTRPGCAPSTPRSRTPTDRGSAEVETSPRRTRGTDPRARRGHGTGRTFPPSRRSRRACPQDRQRPSSRCPVQDRPGPPPAGPTPPRHRAHGHPLRVRPSASGGLGTHRARDPQQQLCADSPRTSRPGSAPRPDERAGWVTSGVVTCSAPMTPPQV